MGMPQNPTVLLYAESAKFVQIFGSRFAKNECGPPSVTLQSRSYVISDRVSRERFQRSTMHPMKEELPMKSSIRTILVATSILGAVPAVSTFDADDALPVGNG